MFKHLTLILALIASPFAAQAGQWQIVPEADPSRCDFRFSGVIGQGDLTGFVDTLRSTPRNGPNIKICLDSEGGLTLEVLSFIEMMDQDLPLFATMVEKDAICTSSCALLFMFGTLMGANSPYPWRYLERGGRLGFHALFAAPDERALARADEVFSIAMQAARLITDRSYRALTTEGPALPQELLSLFFGSTSEDIYFVDAVGELALLGIEMDRSVQDVILPNSAAVFEKTVQRICASSYVLSHPSYFVNSGYSFADLVEEVRRRKSRGIHMQRLEYTSSGEDGRGTITALANGPYSVPLWFSAGAALFCQVRFAVEAAPDGFLINRYNVGFGRVFDMTEDFVDWGDLKIQGRSVGLIPIDQRYE
ncbi:MAG: hypothetical protein JJU24_12120 [Natronohydrobacter sp.]|nr:hypothetical protein [Natronohydrobacter sp.]